MSPKGMHIQCALTRVVILYLIWALREQKNQGGLEITRFLQYYDNHSHFAHDFVGVRFVNISVIILL